MEDSEEDIGQYFAKHISLPQEFDVSEDIQNQSSYTGFKAKKPDVDCLMLAVANGILEDYACDMLKSYYLVKSADKLIGVCGGRLYA